MKKNYISPMDKITLPDGSAATIILIDEEFQRAFVLFETGNGPDMGIVSMEFLEDYQPTIH